MELLNPMERKHSLLPLEPSNRGEEPLTLWRRQFMAAWLAGKRHVGVVSRDSLHKSLLRRKCNPRRNGKRQKEARNPEKNEQSYAAPLRNASSETEGVV